MERGDEATAAEEGCETAGFECNICFGLAKDPVITLCGHLHCWPCLYKWLRFHSQSHECPVCKALIRDEELIHVYGRRGNTRFHRRLGPRRRSGWAETGELGLSAVRRVRFGEFSGYGWVGGDGDGESGVVENDNMKKILFFILLFVIFDFFVI